MLLTCQDGFYKSGTECFQCDDTCETCYDGSASRCYTCASGFFKYKEYSLPLYTGECHKCSEQDENCIECTSECLDDYIDKGDTCDFKCTKCGDGYYVNDEHKCGQCDGSCKTCFGPASNQCIECKEGYMLSGTTCSSMNGTCNDDRCDLGG